MTIRERLTDYSARHPRLKVIVGIFLILVGLFALVTPLTPGSWLVFVGLELLGVRIAAWSRIKDWLFKK